MTEITGTTNRKLAVVNVKSHMIKFRSLLGKIVEVRATPSQMFEGIRVYTETIGVENSSVFIPTDKVEEFLNIVMEAQKENKELIASAH